MFNVFKVFKVPWAALRRRPRTPPALVRLRRLLHTRGGIFALRAGGVAVALLLASLLADGFTHAAVRRSIVRVRLDWAEGAERAEVTSPASFTAGDLAATSGSLSLHVRGGTFTVALPGGSDVAAAFPLRVRASSPLTLRLPGGRSRTYPADLVFIAGEKGGLGVVAEVPLEAYVAGVVVREMGPKFSVEALKAQAVAARSYALSFVSSRAKSQHDLRDSERSQVFAGLTEEVSVLRAVLETRGLVLAHVGSVLRAYYSSTCGGATASCVGRFSDVPESIFRSTTCEDCRASKVWRWTSKPVSEATIAALSPRIKAPLIAVEPSRRDPCGRWVAARVVHSSGETEVSARKLRSACGLRSDFIDQTSRSADGFVFTGRGWGHGVGMCQMGAQGMASRGARFDEILGRYYPGASIEAIEAP